MIIRGYIDLQTSIGFIENLQYIIKTIELQQKTYTIFLKWLYFKLKDTQL